MSSDTNTQKYLKKMLMKCFEKNKYHNIYLILNDYGVYFDLSDIYYILTQYTKDEYDRYYFIFTLNSVQKYLNKTQINLDIDVINSEIYDEISYEIKKNNHPITQDIINEFYIKIFHNNFHENKSRIYHWLVECGIDFDTNILNIMANTDYFQYNNNFYDLLFTDKFDEYINSGEIIRVMDEYNGHGNYFTIFIRNLIYYPDERIDNYIKSYEPINIIYNLLFDKFIKICRLKYYDIMNVSDFRHIGGVTKIKFLDINKLRILFDDDTRADAASNYDQIIAKYTNYINKLKSHNINSEYFDIDPVAARYRDENLLPVENLLSDESSKNRIIIADLQ